MKNYVLGLYEKAIPNFLNWEEKLLTAKAAGFDFMEMSIDETDQKLSRLDMSKKERLNLINLMHEIGLPIRSMCLSGHRKYPLGSNNPETCARGMEIMEKAILLADDLGIRIIQLAGYDVYYEESTAETVARFEKNLKRATLMAACRGITLGFETMETEFMNTVGKSMIYVSKINSSYLQIYPDCGNITNATILYGTNVLDDVQSGYGHIVAMHLKETVPGKFREIPFGTGHVDFKSIIHQAWQQGIRRYVTEFWYTGNENWQEDLINAQNMMAEILDSESKYIECY